jgi:hypothetical protein
MVSLLGCPATQEFHNLWSSVHARIGSATLVSSFAQATAQTSRNARALFTALIPGGGHHDFVEHGGTLEAAQRIAGRR